MMKSKLGSPSVFVDQYTIENAKIALDFFECDMDSVVAKECRLINISKKESNSDIYDRINFHISSIDVVGLKNVTSADVIHHILYEIVSNYELCSEGGVVDTRHLFSIIQESVRRAFFDDMKVLYEWGAKNEHWVNRSLRVINDKSLNKNMLNGSGVPTIERVFNHARNQFVYWTIVHLIDVLNE